MTFLQKIQQGGFWINVLKIAIPFLIVVTLFSLFFNSGSAIFSGDFKTVNEFNFSNKNGFVFGYQKLLSV